MQAAYAEYRRSSAALECTRQTPDDPLVADQIRLTMLEGQQRLAFERYIDARIAFLESRFDEMNRPDDVGDALTGDRDAAVEEESTIKAWASIASGRPALQALAIVLLCTTAFSVTREQRRIRDLEAGQDQLRIVVLKTSAEVRQLREKLDRPNPPAPPLSQPTRRAPVKAAPLRPFPVTRPAGKKLATKRIATSQRGVRGPSSAPAARHPEGQLVCAFSLSTSRQFKRVGPLSVLVKSIDGRKGAASLSIVTETAQLDVEHLRLNQPLWLRVVHYDRPLALVAERISGNRIEGHLWEAESGKRDLRASGFKPKLNSTP